MNEGHVCRNRALWEAGLPRQGSSGQHLPAWRQAEARGAGREEMEMATGVEEQGKKGTRGARAGDHLLRLIGIPEQLPF